MLPILIKMVFISNLLPFMLGDNLSPVEKVQLQLFHDRAASRLEQIFSAEPHKRQLLNTVALENLGTPRGGTNRYPPYPLVHPEEMSVLTLVPPNPRVLKPGTKTRY